jgi:type IX secretion system PorP/SprF family membrane protein
MRTGKILFLGIYISAASVAYGQEYIYSLTPYVPVIYHPTYAAMDNDASVSYVNRRTQIDAGLNYQNNVLTGEYPLCSSKTGKRYGGIGVYFLQKNAGQADMLKSNAIGLSLAYNLPVARNQFISFGIQTNYYNKRTSLDNVSTGSQWLSHEFRFNPEADLGETIPLNRVNYFGFNSGLMWYWEDAKSKSQKAFIGLSTFNMNKPNDSFFKHDNQIPVIVLVNAGAVVLQTQKFQLLPQLIYQKENNVHNVNVLVSGKFLFNNDNPYDLIRSGNVELFSKYDLKKDLSVGIALTQPGFSVGFSYNFSLAGAGSDKYFRNGTEFGVRLMKTVWKEKTKKVVIQNSSINNRRSFTFNEEKSAAPSQENNKQPEPVSDVDVIQQNVQELTKVKAIKFELVKDFKFAFGKADLSAGAKAYLDEIFKLLISYSEYQLEIIGHTDKVGKPLVNYKLSSLRAQAVAEYLIQKGLPAERVKHSGRGDTAPIADNETEENRAKNRRVEFIIYVNR